MSKVQRESTSRAAADNVHQISLVNNFKSQRSLTSVLLVAFKKWAQQVRQPVERSLRHASYPSERPLASEILNVSLPIHTLRHTDPPSGISSVRFMDTPRDGSRHSNKHGQAHNSNHVLVSLRLSLSASSSPPPLIVRRLQRALLAIRHLSLRFTGCCFTQKQLWCEVRATVSQRWAYLLVLRRWLQY